jgi:hypothetical protein
MQFIGRVLQMVGLGLPPLSIVLQLQQTIDVRTMLVMLVSGVCAFYLGRLVEGYAAK